MAEPEPTWAPMRSLGVGLLEATGARTVRARVVGDDDLVSGGGVTSGPDVGLYLLERELGPRIAHAVEELFAYERRGVVWRNAGPAPVAFQSPGRPPAASGTSSRRAGRRPPWRTGPDGSSGGGV
ncbi:hypothetical protein GCM10010466_07780 [Planomonospora alba]|uniref:Uncharacterized protein n=1 Tax=Planomonospora alba TaxID=161354 RepID=A0ABP6MNX2_9ACTN